ncbi:MAG TPA: alpha-amylase family glycosyl hydrolase [Lacibacter sp.]|nr:alpha-amylase family glycosyl hydrolase [Lacibacter sp.]HMO89790.1 alpha-amylase family glycosyl hydrolase [Lacibacter sp.]HMP87110.1 alpha-amylase family glycosyl hydrolase [Lacibacter sp.]
MYIRLIQLFCAFFLLAFVSCKETPKEATAFPDYLLQSNIYEVNVRQYTPEGTFKAFEAHLPRLREMGVDVLWFMPITPISLEDRKGVLGSYYAVADYKAVNPEFGTMDDWKALVKKAHEMGFKVITDWVANHTGADNRWLKSNPGFFVRDRMGKAVYAFDWSDTRDLDYWNPQLRDSMTHALKFWVTETGIDGFRCDVASEVPRLFWEDAIRQLKVVKPDIFLLAEADVAWVHDAGFHASYGWSAFAKMKEVAAGTASPRVLDTVIRHMEETFPSKALKMYFTSNHDENSWNKADYATMPGDVHAPFAVLSMTWKNALPLIYSGQEEPFLDSLSFFYKDTITFGKYERAPFYKTLLSLRKSTPALAVDAAYTRLETTSDDAVYAYLREKGGKKVLVLLNLSKEPQSFMVNLSQGGEATNVFSGTKEQLSDGKNFELAPWGYLVYSF